MRSVITGGSSSVAVFLHPLATLPTLSLSLCVCVCERARVHVCVRVCMCACVRARAQPYILARARMNEASRLLPHLTLFHYHTSAITVSFVLTVSPHANLLWSISYYIRSVYSVYIYIYIFLIIFYCKFLGLPLIQFEITNLSRLQSIFFFYLLLVITSKYIFYNVYSAYYFFYFKFVSGPLGKYQFSRLKSFSFSILYLLPIVVTSKYIA